MTITAGVSAAALLLSGCGGGGDDGGGSGGGDGDMIINARGLEPQNPLIPTSTNEVGGGRIVDLLYAGLVSYTSEGETEMEVADSIESEDNKTWTVKLKDGWTFSDGSAVTANSFVDAWNYGADPENAQLGAYFFYPIEGTTDDGTFEEGADGISGLNVEDDSTFTVTLKDPASDFPDRLGYSSYFPLPEAAFDDPEAFGEAPIGNGPYTLDGWDHDTEARLLANDDYDGNRDPQNDGVTFKFYTDPDAAYTDVQSGVLDVLDEVPTSAISTFTTDDQLQAFNDPGPISTNVTIPDSLEHFGDDEEGKLRRQAISHAIDRGEITSQIFDDTYSPATDFSSPVMPDYSDDIEGSDVLDFDPEKARDLWNQANQISDFDGTFEVSFNADGSGNAEWVEAVTNQLRENLQISAEPKPFATFGEYRELITNRSIGTAFRSGWQPDYPSVYNYLAAVFGTGAGSNDGDYSNPDFDAALVRAASSQDEDERKDALNEAQTILFEDLPAIPLWDRNSYGVAAQGIEGVEMNWQAQPTYHTITK
ncbi:peptide ABC transporter substrate-binding protein [Rothia halotolerans]|uniref:peptide ABC transporter substrate-binding protein n=1 Tax=Rothia halotolerans TaxID=405770 RepID=UPI001EDCD0FA|nr:ABC transporter substrate-binding protein [Rothia halotolerans]